MKNGVCDSGQCGACWGWISFLSYPHSHTWTAPEVPPAWAAVRPDTFTWAGEAFWCLPSTLGWVSISSAR